jgi:hypothetical protein
VPRRYQNLLVALQHKKRAKLIVLQTRSLTESKRLGD